MAENPNAAAEYKNCSGNKRKQPITELDQAIESSFTADVRVHQLVEKKLYDRTFTGYYSMETNEALACRCRIHLDRDHGRTPSKFPRVGHFHFYKCQTRYDPSQSWGRIEPRRRLGFGRLLEPQRLPVPKDTQLRKVVIRKRKTNK